MTTVIQGDAEKVERRFKDQIAADFDTTVEELEAVEKEYPMPNSDEGLVPAEDFYDDEDDR